MEVCLPLAFCCLEARRHLLSLAERLLARPCCLISMLSAPHPLLPRWNVLSALLTKFFPENAFRTAALECLTEIAGLVDLDPHYNPLLQRMFVALVKQVMGFESRDAYSVTVLFSCGLKKLLPTAF